MSRRNGNGQGDYSPRELTPEEIEGIDQSLDSQLIKQVKEILCTLWKQSKITIETRGAGDSALSAALHAIENPTFRNLSLIEGARLSNDQWKRQNEENSREF